MKKTISNLDYEKFNSFLKSTLKYYHLEDIKVTKKTSAGDTVTFAITNSWVDGIYLSAIIVSYNLLTNQIKINFGRFRVHDPFNGATSEFPNDYLDMIVEIKYEGRKLLPVNAPEININIEL